ncbi:hypothetical protein CR513_56681, partial [Mucuna pruriens]
MQSTYGAKGLIIHFVHNDLLKKLLTRDPEKKAQRTFYMSLIQIKLSCTRTHVEKDKGIMHGQNYHCWKQRMIALFNSCHIDMWDIVENRYYIPLQDDGTDLPISLWNEYYKLHDVCSKPKENMRNVNYLERRTMRLLTKGLDTSNQYNNLRSLVETKGYTVHPSTPNT